LTAVYTLLDLYPLVLLAAAIRRRHGKRLDRSRWLVAVFACLSGLIATSSLDLTQGQRFTHWTLADRLAAPLFSVSGNEFTPQAISDSLLLIAIIYALFNYTREASRRQTALEQEHRNARAVQQVLIPEEIPQVPGFAIHSFYKPAGEVGGDFFQIIATGDGGVLAVIGDVSGKGMPAAMTVSLLVGTVRTLAHYTHSPGAILAAMNQRMLGRSDGGFTTCLVLRADMNGALTIANAGHIAPYVAGKELALEGGLPLGLSEETSYVESVFHLAPEEQVTLLTDGVVEARGKTGALFGFERTAALSTQPAQAIALAAQAFGQDDDITVLSLTRLANDEKSAAPVTSPVLSPA
jgi:serine phosphatase RsbU (regulator of sigma subunit)